MLMTRSAELVEIIWLELKNESARVSFCVSNKLHVIPYPRSVYHHGRKCEMIVDGDKLLRTI